MADQDFVLCIYTHPNVGQHRVLGGSTSMDYGYRGGGEVFLVHKADIRLESKKFKPVEIPEPPVPVEAEEVVMPEPPPPVALVEEEPQLAFAGKDNAALSFEPDTRIKLGDTLEVTDQNGIHTSHEVTGINPETYEVESKPVEKPARKPRKTRKT